LFDDYLQECGVGVLVFVLECVVGLFVVLVFYEGYKTRLAYAFFEHFLALFVG
jgi:hypothetical protein